MPLKIACIGEVMIELVLDTPEIARLGIAGDTYNSAVYLAALLGNEAIVSYVTALGTDGFSDRILADMTSRGLATGHVERRVDRMPGLYAIETDAAGERSFSYWRSASAARTLFGEPASVGLDALFSFDVILMTGITLAILPAEIRDRLISTIDAFRAQGGQLAYDSNHRSRLWDSPDEARAVNAKLWRRADIALPSLDDEMVIYGDTSDTAVLARLRGYGCNDGALKRGADGPRAIDPGVPAGTYPSAPEVVDTTAAGDSFNAGFIASRLTGGSIEAAMQSAHDLACRVIGKRGAIVPI